MAENMRLLMLRHIYNRPTNAGMVSEVIKDYLRDDPDPVPVDALVSMARREFEAEEKQRNMGNAT